MKTKEEIQEMLDMSLNKLLANHGGRVDVVEENNTPDKRAIHVSMAGGCRGCARAQATMKSLVERSIITYDPTVTQVVDVTDHSDTSSAFFKE